MAYALVHSVERHQEYGKLTFRGFAGFSRTFREVGKTEKGRKAPEQGTFPFLETCVEQSNNRAEGRESPKTTHKPEEKSYKTT